jgi:hypothetical protein
VLAVAVRGTANITGAAAAALASCVPQPHAHVTRLNAPIAVDICKFTIGIAQATILTSTFRSRTNTRSDGSLLQRRIGRRRLLPRTGQMRPGA